MMKTLMFGRFILKTMPFLVLHCYLEFFFLNHIQTTIFRLLLMELAFAQNLVDLDLSLSLEVFCSIWAHIF